MTNTANLTPTWAHELSHRPRLDDGRRDLRQFHTAAQAVALPQSAPRRLSPAVTVALAVGNGAVLGGLLGSLFGGTAGVVSGLLASVVGYVWIRSNEQLRG